MAMFGFGKGKHEGDAKGGEKPKKDEGKGGKRVFGVPLEALTLVEAKCFDNDALYVPVVVKDTIEWLRRQQGLTEEGIFRVPGNQAEIDALKKQYDTTGSAHLENHYEAHTIAGLLKLWFRELPEPVLIFRYYETFIRVGKNQDPTARKTNLRMLLTGLPEANRSLILYLMEFLKEVASHAEKNKMGTDNVAMVFAPNILRPQGPQDQNSLLNDASAVKDILRTLIEELAFMRAGVMRSRKNIGLPAGETAGANALVSPREHGAVLSPREEALMLSESTKVRTAVSVKDEGKPKEAKKEEGKGEEKKGHKHTRSIGNFIPFVSKGDEKGEAKEPQKSPKAPDNTPKKDTKHGRSESHHVGGSVQKPESARKENTNSALKDPATKPLRRSVSVQSLDDLRSLAKQIDLAALEFEQESGAPTQESSGDHSNSGSTIERPN